MVTDWNIIQNILLLQNGEICITAVHARTPSRKAYINFVRMPCVVNDYGATCVASKNPELFFSQKMQRVLQECLMIIRF